MFGLYENPFIIEILIENPTKKFMLKRVYTHASTDDFCLQSILLALLFSSDKPLSIKDIQNLVLRYHEDNKPLLENEETPTNPVPAFLTAAQIRESFFMIENHLLEKNAPYRLQEGPNGYFLAVAPQFSEWVRLLRNQPKPIKLSAAALETLAIIAYRQPVTRSDMERIRGVAVDSGLTKLLDLGLIMITGRADLPGKPTLYGTTEKFLTWLGLPHLEALPAVEGLKTDDMKRWLGQIFEQSQMPLNNETVGLSNP